MNEIELCNSEDLTVKRRGFMANTRRGSRFIATCSLAIALSVVITGCGVGLARDSGTVTGQQAASFAKLKLPASARDFDVHHDRGIDERYRFSFRLDRKDLNVFISDSALPPLESGLRAISKADAEAPEWPRSQLKQVTGVGDDRSGLVRKVVVDLSDPSVVTVYVKSFRT